MMTFIEVRELKGIAWREELVLSKTSSYLNNIADDRDTRNMHASSESPQNDCPKKPAEGFDFGLKEIA